MRYPQVCNVFNDVAVAGWSNIYVFMAGHSNKGFLKSQARNTQRDKLSAIPALALAIKSAEAGATNNTSAHRLGVVKEGLIGYQEVC